MPGAKKVFVGAGPNAKSPSSNVHANWLILPPLVAVALALKWTTKPLGPLVRLADAVTVGAATAVRRNHGVAVGSVLKKASNILPTLAMPLALGCVRSLPTSCKVQVKPSERGLEPLAHRYGPQDKSGATTGPLVGSKLRLPTPLSWSAIAPLTANPDS